MPARVFEYHYLFKAGYLPAFITAVSIVHAFLFPSHDADQGIAWSTIAAFTTAMTWTLPLAITPRNGPVLALAIANWTAGTAGVIAFAFTRKACRHDGTG